MMITCYHRHAYARTNTFLEILITYDLGTNYLQFLTNRVRVEHPGVKIHKIMGPLAKSYEVIFQ